jgi:hypothetical protein
MPVSLERSLATNHDQRHSQSDGEALDRHHPSILPCVAAVQEVDAGFNPNDDSRDKADRKPDDKAHECRNRQGDNSNG